MLESKEKVRMAKKAWRIERIREKMSSIVKQKTSEMNNTGKLKLISYVKFEQNYWNVELKDWRQ